MSLDNYIQSVKQMTNEDEIVGLIKDVIENQQIFVFGELLEQPNIASLKQSAAVAWFNLLELFAFGKLSDYNEKTMPVLTDLMIKKLRLLTIVTLASSNRSKKISYSVLSEELKISNLRDLEDLIIEAIYTNLVRGKLDQKSVCLEVECTLARDVKLDRIDDITNVLSSWITNCDNILTNLDKQAKIANSIKSENLSKKVELEGYISSIKKTIKTTNQELMEDAWEINSMQHHDFEKSKRNYYSKPARFPSLKQRNRF